jgi:hypothetical protein
MRGSSAFSRATSDPAALPPSSSSSVSKPVPDVDAPAPPLLTPPTAAPGAVQPRRASAAMRAVTAAPASSLLLLSDASGASAVSARSSSALPHTPSGAAASHSPDAPGAIAAAATSSGMRKPERDSAVTSWSTPGCRGAGASPAAGAGGCSTTKLAPSLAAAAAVAASRVAEPTRNSLLGSIWRATDVGTPAWRARVLGGGELDRGKRRVCDAGAAGARAVT